MFCTLMTCSWVISPKSVPLGKYCLMSPFVFSLAPLSHEWYVRWARSGLYDLFLPSALRPISLETVLLLKLNCAAIAFCDLPLCLSRFSIAMLSGLDSYAFDLQ